MRYMMTFEIPRDGCTEDGIVEASSEEGLVKTMIEHIKYLEEDTGLCLDDGVELVDVLQNIRIFTIENVDDYFCERVIHKIDELRGVNK